MELSSNRFRWMSFCCACLVPLIHMTSFGVVSLENSVGSSMLFHFLHHGIASIAVPYFFFASGFWLGKHDLEVDYTSEIKKRCVTLLIPIMIWGSLWWVYRWRCSVSWSSTVGLCVGLPKYEPLWFLRTLFIIVIVSPVLRKLSENRLWMLFLFVFSIGYPLFVGRGILYQFLRYFISPGGIFWFSCGLIMSDKRKIHWLTMERCLVLFAIGILILALKIYLPDVCMISVNQMAVPFLLCGLSGLMPKREIPYIFTSIPMLMYLSHEFFIYAFYRASLRIGYSNVIWWYYLITSVLVVLVSVIFSCSIKRLFPVIGKCLSGGR